MKKHNSILKIAATAAMAVASIVPSFAQTNLGATCGCPPVASRTQVNLSSVGATPIAGFNESVLTPANVILTCDKIWVLDRRYYVDSLKSIIIQPGTVIKGKKYSTGDSSSALVIQRGAKIFADGSPDCQIVFTGINDPMDGTYGVSHRGDWGGLVIDGMATNNLTLAANGPPSSGHQCVQDGVGYMEGWPAGNARNYHGAPIGMQNDNDNSGVLRYVSVRHAGAIISTGNELNGISLGSVGRGTTIEHVEVISSDDDGIEFFGGTVNIKYVACMFGADDMFDWDEGYSGKMQFVFGIQPDSITCNTSDNGFEADTWDNTATGANPDSHPFIYNGTLIGNHSSLLNSDNSGHAAIMFKDGTQGEIYNSVFANFKLGLELHQTGQSGQSTYDNWNNNLLKAKCNTFVNTKLNAFGNVPMAVAQNPATITAADTVKFNSDLNKHSLSVPGFDFALAMNSSNNAVSHQYDAVPNPAISTTCAPPVDGFFVSTNYAGAFASTGKNWLSDWSYATLLQTTAGLQPCPTDINQDGITDNQDFLLLVGQFNQKCQ